MGRSDGGRNRSRRLQSALLMLALPILFAGNACRRGRATDEAEALRRQGYADVEWGGCSLVVTGPRCEFSGTGHLAIWTTASDAPQWVFVTGDGLTIRRNLTRIQDGWAIAVDIPPSATRILALRSDDRVAVWSLATGQAP